MEHAEAFANTSPAGAALHLEPLEQSARLEKLTQVLRDLSADDDPIRAVNRYATEIRKLYGNQAMVSVSLRGQPPGYYRVMRFLHQPGASEEGMPDLFFAGPGAPAVTGGILGDIIAGGKPVICRNMRIDWDPVLEGQLAPYRLLVGFPIFTEGEVTNWVFFLHRESEAFTDHDVEMLIMQASLLGGITNSKRMTQELREATQWINREVGEIANLQKGLLPQHLPQSDAFELAACYATFERAGGDYYDAFPMPGQGGSAEDGVGLFIADASGHGPSAAVVVAMVHVLLRSYPGDYQEPGRVLDHLNKHLSETAINHSFVTAFYGVYTPGTNRLRYACAGHPMPLIRGVTGEPRVLERARNVPLGVQEQCCHDVCEAQLGAGEAVLLYTDGITEARGPGKGFYGEDRLIEVFLTARGDGAAIIERVQADLRAHQAGMAPPDDQTMLLLQVKPY